MSQAYVFKGPIDGPGHWHVAWDDGRTYCGIELSGGWSFTFDLQDMEQRPCYRCQTEKRLAQKSGKS